MPEKLHRCVDHVKGDVKNPWAVCNASISELEDIITRNTEAPKARESNGHFTTPRGNIHEGGQGSGRKPEGTSKLKQLGAKVSSKVSQHYPEFVNQAQHQIPDLLGHVFATEPTQEGGVGSGRRPQHAHTKAHPKQDLGSKFGWKNYGIDDYISDAERDYLSKKKGSNV